MSSGGTNWWEPKGITRRSGAQARVATRVGQRRTTRRSGWLTTSSSQVVGSAWLVFLVLERWRGPRARAEIGGGPVSFPSSVAVVITIHLDIPHTIFITPNVYNQIPVAFVSAVTLMSRFTELGLQFHLLCCDFIVRS